MRACLAEFMAMHMFVLLCCGCAMVTLNLPEPNLMMVAASFGFGILTLAQVFGPLSGKFYVSFHIVAVSNAQPLGGHINCAVSFALFLAGRISLIRAFCYTISQMFGAVFGALFLWVYALSSCVICTSAV
jgi:glycerol uptake facilitator-like aquaporin